MVFWRVEKRRGGCSWADVFDAFVDDGWNVGFDNKVRGRTRK